MGTMRIPNPNLARNYTTYSIVELSAALGVHYHTVRKWVRMGLTPIDDRFKMYFRGEDVRAFLIAQRKRTKRPCLPGTIYCIPCQAPKAPAGGMVEYRPITPRRGQLVGICPSCERMVYRITGAAQVEALTATFAATRIEE
ncbi:helix-turn-helix domain-containing protein [Phreatobacter oligotrophus]|uniref:MerR-like DNA binding protein n=1 Tax=Phreatobacter oligotrophus TaxID=1122261 RepID=A0A2T4ZDY1_9HYPH|nr:helix-turn-helix domain-containing protein [Phreatobacter oligotrophus]PTM60077.1 MerR-like DNA binding protein [Phreatobacter oligotrophus]